MVSDAEREFLRSCMPEVLGALCGIEDVRRTFRCPSPDHEDRTPSAHYYERDHSVHCFGCNRSWDVFSLVGMLRGVEGFPAQAREVAGIVGYDLDEGAPAPPRIAHERLARPLFDPPREVGDADCAQACNEAWLRLYEPEGEIGRRWLAWRGIDDADAATFGLGFTSRPAEIMPEFRVWEPRALGFVVIPFWDRDFRRARYCMLRTVARRGEARVKEWRPRGLATPLWNEWLLSCGADVVYVTEGLIDAMALAKITCGDVMALGGVSNARRLAQVLYATPVELRPRTVVVCMDEDDAGHRACAAICADLDRLLMPHAVMPPYPGGAKDADQWLMDIKGIEWERDLFDAPAGAPLWKTRWKR